MADKDIVEKTLEVHNDVFCDIMNVLLFDGKRVVREEELRDALARSHYKADDGKLHEMERDTAKYWMDSQVRIAFIGYENQTEPDGDAPLRGMGYDGAEYRKQMLGDVLGERKEKMTMGDVFGPLIAEGEARGLVRGKKEGMNRMASFADILLSEGRVEDLKYALKNEEYCEKLMKEILADSNKTY